MQRLELDEKKFRYLLNEDAMATEKTAEGIRKFAADIAKLEKFVQEDQLISIYLPHHDVDAAQADHDIGDGMAKAHVFQNGEPINKLGSRPCQSSLLAC